LISTANIEEKITSFAKTHFLENTEPIVIDIIKSILKPNLIFNQELTRPKKDFAVNNVPLYDGFVQAGENYS